VALLFKNEGTGVEPIGMQQSGGLLLPPVRKLAATLIFCNAENANRLPYPTLLQIPLF